MKFPGRRAGPGSMPVPYSLVASGFVMRLSGHGGNQAVEVAQRHGETAVFAAEATGRLTRDPGLAVVTAGPGVTNSVSAVTSAYFNGAPLVVLAGRAPDYRWGAGSLQEMD